MNADWLVDQLPAHLVSDDFFRRFVALFADMADETLAHADALAYLADVELTPEPMVPYLAGWLGFDAVDTRLPLERRRELVANVGPLNAWRGTRRGLEALLALVTEGPAEVTDTGGVYAEGEAPPAERHVTIRLATTGRLTADHVARLARDEVPADCTFELWVGGALVAGPSREGRG